MGAPNRAAPWKSTQPHIAVPWKRCEVHDVVFLYGRLCPCCLSEEESEEAER